MFLINVLFVLTTLLGEPLGVEVCQNQAQIFNEEIGTIIDYEENTKYNIFGDI